MPFKVISQKGFVKGVVASMDRFSVPKGAVLRASNLLLSDRGAFTVCDGTAWQSDLPGASGPIIELGLYVSPTFGVVRLAGVLNPSTGHLDVYQWLATQDTLAFLFSVTLTSGWIMPQFIEYAGATIISVGNGVTPYQYLGGGGISQLTANSGGPGGGAAWQANHSYAVGDRITADDGNSKVATFQVVSVTVGSASGTMANATPIGGIGGLSGSSEPNFAGTNIIGTGNTVSDNQLIWMLVKENADFGKEAVPFGAAHIINHSAALWAWNTSPTNTSGANGVIDGPSVVRQSGINNPNSWPLANYAFIGKDDGTQGTGIATFTIAEAGISPTGALVLFKEYSTYQVNGTFGIQNFNITEVKTDMGCLASRSVQFATGFGILRFCHLGFALFDGVNDRLVSEEVRPYVFGNAEITGIDYTALQWGRSMLTANPPMYVCSLPTKDGLINRVFCYDLVMRAWAIVDYMNSSPNWPITAMAQIRPPAVPGQNAGAVSYIGDLNRSNNTVTIRRWQAGDPAWDATAPATPIAWMFRPPEVGDPASRAYFRRANVRLTAPNPGTLTGLFNIGTESQPNNAQPERGAGPSSGMAPNVTTRATYNGKMDLGVALDIGQTGPSMNGTYSSSGPGVIEGVDYHIVAKPPRPFGQAF
jgi:hypothetical protein